MSKQEAFLHKTRSIVMDAMQMAEMAGKSGDREICNEWHKIAQFILSRQAVVSAFTPIEGGGE